MVDLLGASDIRELAARLDVVPTKKLGQNFVTDPNTIRRIVTAAKLSGQENVVEIGPGLGSLTLGLLEVAKTVTSVEIDTKMAAALEATIAKRAEGKSFTLVTHDAMTITSLPISPDALVANLPYNISVPVLLNFMERFPSIVKGLVLVQAEVAERLAAKPGSKVYGSPSAKLAWYGNANLAGNVARSIFWPVPNVDSSLVYFERSAQPRGSEELRQATFAVIDAAFGQRRKTLRQALSEWAGSPALAEQRLVAAGVSPQLRGEQLNIDQFVKIASIHGRHSEPGKPIGRDADIREFFAEEVFECEPARLFVILGDIDQWPPAGNPRMLSRKEPNSVQVSFADATRALVTFERGEKPGTAKLVVHHDLCKDGHQTRSWKAYWKGHFKALSQRVQL